MFHVTYSMPVQYTRTAVPLTGNKAVGDGCLEKHGGSLAAAARGTIRSPTAVCTPKQAATDAAEQQ